MKHSFKITPHDIDKIVEFALEDLQQSQFSIDDIEENIGLYLENIPGMDLINDKDQENLIITISDKVRTVLTLNTDVGKV